MTHISLSTSCHSIGSTEDAFSTDAESCNTPPGNVADQTSQDCGHLHRIPGWPVHAMVPPICISGASHDSDHQARVLLHGSCCKRQAAFGAAEQAEKCIRPSAVRACASNGSRSPPKTSASLLSDVGPSIHMFGSTQTSATNAPVCKLTRQPASYIYTYHKSDDGAVMYVTYESLMH